MKWDRGIHELCRRPDKFQWKFSTERMGCFKIKFSNRGRYLAGACTLESSKTLIKIWNVETGEIHITLIGHQDLIHDLVWSSDDNYILSSSADASLKLWNMTDKEGDYPNKLHYNQNSKHYQMCQIVHPSYVYGGQFFPDNNPESNERLIFASVCFDQKVRLWIVAIGIDGEYLHHGNVIN